MYALAPRNLQHAPYDVLIAVQNNMVRPIRPRDRRLLRRARRPDDDRPAPLAHLCEPQPEPARDGVHEHAVPLPHVVRLGRERQRGQALHEARSADVGRDCPRERDDEGPVGDRVFCERPFR